MPRQIIKYLILATGWLFLISPQAKSQTRTKEPIQLKLRKGDQFSYRTTSARSYVYKMPGGEVQTNTQTSRSKHLFHVEGVPDPGTYILKYKKLYTLEKHLYGNQGRESDSRFPEYGTHYESQALCFLNEVEYRVLFSPSEHKLQITNLEKIRKDLIKYLEERGFPAESNTRGATMQFLQEKTILDGISFLNFYPGDQAIETWSVDHAPSLRETFDSQSALDSTEVVNSEITNYGFFRGAYIAEEGIYMQKQMLIHRSTGLLMHAESSSHLVDGGQKTELLYSTQSDIKDYQQSIELENFSRWEGPTVIKGRINIPGISRVVLTSETSMAGTGRVHQIIELNPGGTFRIPLEINHPKKFRLYLLEKFPTRSNVNFPLYVEVGDSIHMEFSETNGKRQTIYTGRGYQNSRVLNDLYKNESYGKFLVPGHILYPFWGVYQFIRSEHDSIFWAGVQENMASMTGFLESKRNELTPGFYSCQMDELKSLSYRLALRKGWSNGQSLISAGNEGPNPSKILPAMFTPEYPHFENLSHYRTYIHEYAGLRYKQFNSLNEKNIYGRSNVGYYADGYAFLKALYTGYPLYAEIANIFEYEISTASHPINRDYSIYQDILNNCNNQDLRDYIIAQELAYSSLNKGSDIPTMELLDMDGEQWDWKRNKNKVTVLLIYKSYSGEHFYCEDLFTEFGENKEDVVIMRISPGISFDQWKSFNSRYSEKPHQMYFVDGEGELHDRFFLNTYPEGSKYLVIDRSGKIYANCDRHALKSWIKRALNEEIPKKSFLESAWARIIPGVLLGMVLTVIFSRIILRRRLRKKAQEYRLAELEHKAIIAQLNPHFMFNCLNSIQNLIRSDRKKEADQYLSTFAILIRKVLENSEKNEISISEELDSLKLYLELEQMRFSFKFTIEIEPDIDIYNTSIPTMLLQPLVENAVLHGLDPKKENRKLSIRILSRNDTVLFLLEDNGIGREASQLIENGHDSKGLQIIESRIALLNKMNSGDYKLSITDRKDEHGHPSGTSVELLIPDEK